MSWDGFVLHYYTSTDSYSVNQARMVKVTYQIRALKCRLIPDLKNHSVYDSVKGEYFLCWLKSASIKSINDFVVLKLFVRTL